MLFLCAIILLSAAFGVSNIHTAAAEEWVCGNCNIAVTGKFCSNCGQKRPDQEGAETIEDGKIVLLLHIDFEKNMFFSTYDVDMYLNDEKIAVIAHGEPCEKVVSVAQGEYALTFYKKNDHEVMGKVKIGVSANTTFRCMIHAKNDKIVIDKIMTDSDEVDTRTAIGEQGQIKDILIRLTNVTESKGSSYNKPESGSIFVLCEFEIENQSKGEITVSSLANFEAYCDGYKYSPSFGASLESSLQLDGSLDPGRKMKGSIGFEVPKNWKELEIQYEPSFWSSDSISFVAFNK